MAEPHSAQVRTILRVNSLWTDGWVGGWVGGWRRNGEERRRRWVGGWATLATEWVGGWVDRLPVDEPFRMESMKDLHVNLNDGAKVPSTDDQVQQGGAFPSSSSSSSSSFYFSRGTGRYCFGCLGPSPWATGLVQPKASRWVEAEMVSRRITRWVSWVGWAGGTDRLHGNCPSHLLRCSKHTTQLAPGLVGSPFL